MKEYQLSNVAGEHQLGMKANTLTVSARRKGVPLTEYLWQIAEQRALLQIASIPSAAAPLELHEPEPISFVGPLGRNFTIAACFRTLDDLRMNRDGLLPET